MASPAVSPRRTAAAIVVALYVFTIFLTILGTPVHAALMAIRREGRTVAGVIGFFGLEDGVAGQSLVYNPSGICGNYNPSDTNTLLFGVNHYFRTYQRNSTYAGTWFGRLTTNNQLANVGGSLTEAALANAVVCAQYPTSDTQAIVYYLPNTGNTVWWVANGQVSSAVMPSNPYPMSLTGLAVYRNNLYLLNLTNGVMACTISPTNPSPTACEFRELDSGTGKINQGVAVGADGVFVATDGGIIRDTTPLTTILSTVSVKDVRYDTTGTRIFAASESMIYQLIPNGNDLNYEILAGSAGPCPSSSYCDGFDPQFNGIYRIYPVDQDEIYISAPQLQLLRALVVPPVGVPLDFVRNPFPIGFVDEEDIMPALYTLMDGDLRVLTAGATVNEKSGTVNDATWDTLFDVEVPQRSFDNDTTVAAVTGTDFSNALHTLRVYYNLTDEVIFSDANLLPICVKSQMLSIEHEIAYRARFMLEYPLIYTDPSRKITINENPNITITKLLMPALFGNVTPVTNNETTHPLIEEGNFTELVLQAVREAYPENRKANVSFSGKDFPFDRVPPDVITEARWYVLDVILNRLKQCAQLAGDPSGGAAVPGDDVYEGCVSTVGITNVTDVLLPGDTFTHFQYEVFVPENFNYTFNITRCIEGIDWDDFQYWLGNRTMKPNERKCDTGCIVGIAVAAGVVAAVLVVVAVVLISKRRRLATVVTPSGQAAEPKFASTVDLDAADEYPQGARNPLDV